MSELDIPESMDGMDTAAPVEGTPDVGQQPNPEVQAPEFDAQQWGYKFKGKDYFPTDRNHLINLAQKGHSFESRMEALNKQQGEFDGLKEKYGQYEELDNLFQGNPEFQSAVMKLRQQHLSGEQETPGIDPKVSQELDELKRWRETETSRREDEKLQSEIDKMKADHPDHDWNTDSGEGELWKQILMHAQDKGIDKLESAYRDFHYDSLAVQAKAQALKQNADQKQKMSKAGIVQGGTPTAKPAAQGVNVSDLSYNDLKNKALNEMSG